MADGALEYILIQTKNRATEYPSDIQEAVSKYIPITKKLKPHDALPNFAKYNPTNAYISILIEFGIEKHSEKSVQLTNVIGLKKKREMIYKKKETVKETRKNLAQSEKLKNLEQEL